MVSRDEWGTLLAFLIGGIHEGVLVSLSAASTDDISKKELESVISEKRHSISVDDPMSGVFLSKKILVIPVLEAGQHQQVVLIELLEDQDQAVKSDDAKTNGLHAATEKVCGIQLGSIPFQSRVLMSIPGLSLACRSIYTRGS